MKRSRSAIISFVFLAFVILCFFPPAQADMPISGNEFWYDDFNGAIGAQPPKWYDTTNDSYNEAEIAYSEWPSYAVVTPTAGGTRGQVMSERIRCNVDIYDTLEIRVVRFNLAGQDEWSIGLQEVGGNFHSLHDMSGSAGTFTFFLKDNLNWSGTREFNIYLRIDGQAGSFLIVDYISIFQNQSPYQKFWREDFVVATGDVLHNWVDENTDDTVGAEIKSIGLPNESFAKVTMLDGIPNTAGAFWGKVISPGFFWNVDKYDYVEIQVTDVSPNTSWKIVVRELFSPWGHYVVGSGVFPGIFTMRLSEIPDWSWTGKKMLALELIIEGELPYADNYTVDYISIFKLVSPPTPTPIIPVFPEGGYATPNPFLPSRGQKTYFNLEFSDPGTRSTIRIMNIQGRVVRTLNNANPPEWDGRNDAGHLCEGGLYIYQIESGGRRVTGKVVLIR